MSTNILFPAGRLIGGNVYRGSDRDAEGKQRTVKTGVNAGQPAVQFYILVAIKKGAEQSWAQTEWGQKLYAEGQAAFPQAFQSPAFAWKVKDGDSTIPNRRGKRPCDMEGAPGHWLLSFTSGFAPKVVDATGDRYITEPDAIKPGYFVQVYGNAAGNGSVSQPGVFLNHQIVSLQGYGAEIATGVDAASIGFGAGPLPAGASAVPVGQMAAPAAPLPGLPALPGAPAAAPVVAVAPHPGILVPPAAPAVPAAPPAPVARVMTAKAAGASYEAFVAGGWKDADLIAQGFMLP